MATLLGAPLDVLLFEVGGQLYGLPARDVRRVLRAVSVVRLPRAPAVIEGVIDVHGTILAVVDIRARFRLPPKRLHPDDHLIVADAGRRDVAVRADRALAIVHLAGSAVQRIDDEIPGVGLVAGVARLADGLALIHDLRTFLTAHEASALDEAMAQPGAPTGAR
jgi:purine-binding chemotaxis protein CheW